MLKEVARGNISVAHTGHRLKGPIKGYEVDADGIVLVSRGDLFPADHGAAVKIVETARGLSRNGRPVALVTDDRRYWWRLEDGTRFLADAPESAWPGMMQQEFLGVTGRVSQVDGRNLFVPTDF